MQKIKLFLDKNRAYFTGAGSLLDFAGTLNESSSLMARRAARQRGLYGNGQNWSKVGEDFQAAMQELSRVTKG